VSVASCLATVSTCQQFSRFLSQDACFKQTTLGEFEIAVERLEFLLLFGLGATSRNAMNQNILALGGFLTLAMVMPAQAALFSNASFETVPNNGLGQGLLPTGWINATNTTPGADTYSFDNTYGLTTGSFNHFLSPFTPYDGNRWVAGADFGNGLREGIGQLLPINLVAGDMYDFQAAVTYTTLFGGGTPRSGGWELILSPTASVADPLAVSVGSLAATQLDTWQVRTLSFVAPTSAASLPYLLLLPYSDVRGSVAYLGIDGPISIERSQVGVVPEPASCLAWLAGIAAVAGWRRHGRRCSIAANASHGLRHEAI